MEQPESAPQLSEQWFAARLGCVTASRMGDLMAKTKSGYGASRENYMAELIAERLTGTRQERFENAAMKWGVETEAQARIAYEFLQDVTVEQAGFIPHPALTYAGASPDGLVGAEGLVEIKCPNTAMHIDTLLSSTIAAKYVYQMQWQMACTARKWCDFFSFDPRMPASMQVFQKRVSRDPALIDELEREVRTFLEELARKVMALTAKYETAQAA